MDMNGSKKLPIFLEIKPFGKINIPIFYNRLFKMDIHMMIKKGLTSPIDCASQYLLFNAEILT